MHTAVPRDLRLLACPLLSPYSTATLRCRSLTGYERSSLPETGNGDNTSWLTCWSKPLATAVEFLTLGTREIGEIPDVLREKNAYTAIISHVYRGVKQQGERFHPRSTTRATARVRPRYTGWLVSDRFLVEPEKEHDHIPRR